MYRRRYKALNHFPEKHVFAGQRIGKSKSIFAAKIDEIIGLMPLVGSCTARLATWKLSFHEPEVSSDRKG